MSRRNNIIIVVGVVFFVALGSFFIYAYIGSRKDAGTNVQENDTILQTTVSSSTFTAVITNVEKKDAPPLDSTNPAIVSVQGEDVERLLNTNDGSFYYLGRDRTVYSVVGNDVKKVYEFDAVPELLRISPKGNRALVKLRGRNTVVDFDTRSETLLSPNILDMAWSADAERIAYQYYDAFNRVEGLYTSKPDGSDFKQLIDFREGRGNEQVQLIEIEVDWKDSENIFWNPIPTSIDGTSLNLVSLEGNTILTNLPDTINTHHASPDGQFMVYDVLKGGLTEDLYYELFMYDFNTKQSISMGIQGAARKCAFISNNDVICALSQDLLTEDTPEILVKYSKATGETAPFAQIDENHPVIYDSLQYVSQSNELIFLNKKSGAIEKLSLK